MILTLASSSGLLLLQQTQPASQPTATPSVQAVGSLLIYFFILVLVFIVGSYAMVRMFRRFRESLERGRPQPTTTDDIWAMHRLPEDDDSAEQDDHAGDVGDEDDGEEWKQGGNHGNGEDQ